MNIKKIILGLITILLSITITSAEYKTKQKFFGFSQVGMAGGKGAIADNQKGSYKFEEDRIRIGWKYFSGPLAGKVVIDFAKRGTDGGGVGVPDLLKDAFITYNFDTAVILKAGLMKTPLGMSFTISGWNLDVIKRGFDKKLALERATGLMLSGRNIGFGYIAKVNGLESGHERPWKGFGYDLMLTSQTGRSGAVINAKQGDDNAYIARVMFDWEEALHIEASYGQSNSAGGIDTNTDPAGNQGTENYEVVNLGLDSHFNGFNFKAEYYDSKNIRGILNWDINSLALTGTYFITADIELAVKDIRGTETRNAIDNKAANTYIGINYYINPKNSKMDRKSKRSKNKHRMQFNYVLTDVDTGFRGVGALYREDVLLAQYQFAF